MATAAAERQNPFRGVVNGIRLHNVRDAAEAPWWYKFIFRNRAAHEWSVDASAERVRPGQMKGKPAVFVLPAGDPFFPTAMVTITGPLGITVVQGDGVPFEEVLKVAKGLEP